MTTDPTVILADILDIVNYPKDKKTFIDQFSQNCMIKGFSEIENSLPLIKKAELASAILGKERIEEFKKVFYQAVSHEQYEKAIQNATSDLFVDFLQSIECTLTDAQSSKLDAYLALL